MTNLKIGQVWVCGAFGASPPLMCIIGRLDQFSDLEDGPRIVSICVTPHPQAQKAGWQIVSHMPVFEEAFQMSELTLAKEGVSLGSDFDSGYSQWRSAFQDGKAGAFSIKISEAYAGIVSVKREH